jgi:hypothetical protein
MPITSRRRFADTKITEREVVLAAKFHRVSERERVGAPEPVWPAKINLQQRMEAIVTGLLAIANRIRRRGASSIKP